MKYFKRWLLKRELRQLKRELDYTFAVRRETIRRETKLRRQAEAISADLMRMEIGGRRA